MCLVANGQDGNGLQLENFWQIVVFFKDGICVSLENDFG